MLITPDAIGRHRPRLRPAGRHRTTRRASRREPWDAGLPLTPEEHALVRAYVEDATPRAEVAWLLWLGTGLAGGHRFYLGPRWLGALMLAVNGTMVIVTGGLWLLPAVMWWLGDGWLVPERLDAAQHAAASAAARSVLDARAQGSTEAAAPATVPVAADATAAAAMDATPGDGAVSRFPGLPHAMPDASQAARPGDMEGERAAG